VRRKAFNIVLQYYCFGRLYIVFGVINIHGLSEAGIAFHLITILELFGGSVIGFRVFVRSFPCLSPFVTFTDVRFIWTTSRPLELQFTGM
jgi:hypothetical protein